MQNIIRNTKRKITSESFLFLYYGRIINSPMIFFDVLGVVTYLPNVFKIALNTFIDSYSDKGTFSTARAHNGGSNSRPLLY